MNPTPPPPDTQPHQQGIPAVLTQPGAVGFWIAVILTGVGTGIGAAALTNLLWLIQHWIWPGAGLTLAEAASQATPGTWRAGS